LKSKVADIIVDYLVAAGVRHVYGIAGDSLNAFTENFRRQTDIRWVNTRHEEAAAFAAGAEAQLTGRLSACAGSCGPGNLHLINGLYDANRSRSPVVAPRYRAVSWAPTISKKLTPNTYSGTAVFTAVW